MSLNKCGDVLPPREVCCELCNPLYEVFCSSRGILGQHSPRAAAACCPSSPCTAHHRAPQQRAGCRATGLSEGGIKPQRMDAPRAGGHRSAPKPSMEGRWRAGSLWPPVSHRDTSRGWSSHTPPSLVGRGPELAWRWQRGCRWDSPPQRSQVNGTTEGEGQPVPESRHSRPGCRHRPLANAFHAARLGMKGGAAAESLSALAGKSASPTAAGSFLLISSQPACGLPAPASAEHPGPPHPSSAKSLLARGKCIPPAQPGF